MTTRYTAEQALARMECPDCGSKLKLVAASNPAWRERVCLACSKNWGAEAPDGVYDDREIIPSPEETKREPTAKQLRRRNRKARKTIDRNRNRIARGKPRFLEGPDDQGKLYVALASGQRVRAWLYRETADGELLVGWTGKKEATRVRRKDFREKPKPTVKAESSPQKVIADMEEAISNVQEKLKPKSIVFTLDDIRSGRFKASLADRAI